MLLLSIDPAEGGLVKHNRRRLRRALRADGGRRRARQELAEAGLVEPGRRLLIADRSAAAERWRAVRRCVLEDDCADERHRVLGVLLAWTGVLASRLSRGERRIAARKLRGMISSPEFRLAPETGSSGEPFPGAWLAALGAAGVADLVHHAVSDFGGGDFGGLDPGAGHHGGFDAGGGHHHGGS